jgi:sugar phosphate isomerase/epimerase
VTLSTGSLYNWALDRVFELANSVGYDGVELLVDARMDSYDVSYLQQLIERWQIPILSVHSPFAARLEGWPEEPEGRLQQAVRLAECLGAETVVAHAPLRWPVGHVQVALGQHTIRREFLLPWPSAAGARHYRWLRDELPDFQAQTAVRIAIENMPARRVCGWPVRFHRCSEVGDLAQFAYVVLDTTHWGTCGVEPLAVYRALRAQVVHVHLADYDGREHRLPFKGHLDLAGLLRAIGEGGFGGCVVVEAEPWAVAEGKWSERHMAEQLGAVAAMTRAFLRSGAAHGQLAESSQVTSLRSR